MELKDPETAQTNVNLDSGLSRTEKSKTVAWSSHIESHLGDIVVSASWYYIAVVINRILSTMHCIRI